MQFSSKINLNQMKCKMKVIHLFKKLKKIKSLKISQHYRFNFDQEIKEISEATIKVEKYKNMICSQLMLIR